MNKFSNDIDFLKRLYNEGKNIMEYLKSQSLSTINTVDAIKISYDLQAGSYIKMVNSKPEYISLYTDAIAKILNSLQPYNSLLEIGVGEATTLGNVLSKIDRPQRVFGFDISWSRIKFAQSYLKNLKIDKVELFIADLFNIPLADNSIDIVYTSHSIEPNGGKEHEALKELYRVCKKYIVLLEPGYEFASTEAQERMKSMGYATNIYNAAQELGYKIIEHRLFDICSNPLNPTSLIIIEKQVTVDIEAFYICPISKCPMEKVRDAYYCNKSMLLYPIFDSIPCLLDNYGLIATHYLDENIG